MDKINIGIVASEFNYDITYAMVELAKEHAKFLGANIYKIIKVPGTFDMPLAVKILLEKKEISAVVALGAVIEGQTEHDEIIMQHASRKISDLSLEYKKPVALGISGPGMSRIEALERVDYAKRAVEAAVKMCKIISEEKNETVNEAETEITLSKDLSKSNEISKSEKTKAKKTRGGPVTKETKETEPTKETENIIQKKKTKKITKKTKIKGKKEKTKRKKENIIQKKKTKRKLPYEPIMNAFKGKFKNKTFIGTATDIDNIISALSGTQIETKGEKYDAGELVKNIKNDLLDGKIMMPRKLMQAVAKYKKKETNKVEEISNKVEETNKVEAAKEIKANEIKENTKETKENSEVKSE